MYVLLEVSAADRIYIIPRDGAVATVREVGRGATLADIANLADAEAVRAAAGPLPVIGWADPDNDDIEPDEPTPLEVVAPGDG